MKMEERIRKEEDKKPEVESIMPKPKKTDFGRIVDELEKCCRYTVPNTSVEGILQRIEIRKNIKRGIKLLKKGFEMAGTDETKKALMVNYAFTLGNFASAQGYFDESEKLYKMALDNYSPKARISKETIEKTYKNLSMEKANYTLEMFRVTGELVGRKAEEAGREVFDTYLKFHHVEGIYKIWCSPTYQLYFPRKDLTLHQLRQAVSLLIEDMEKKVNRGEHIGVSEWDLFLTALSEITYAAYRKSRKGINIFVQKVEGGYQYTEFGEKFKNFWESLDSETQRDLKTIIERRKEEKGGGYSILWETFFDEHLAKPKPLRVRDEYT